MGPCPGHWHGGHEEVVAAEAGVPFAAVGVEDPEGRPLSRRAGPVAGHDHLRPLADDVAPEPDPRSPGELEPDAGGLADRTAEARSQVRRLEDREADPGSTGEGCQAPEPIADGSAGGRAGARGGTGVEPRREIDDQQVHGPPGQQRARDRQSLVDVDRGHDDEPFRPDPPSDRLDRVERLGEVQPGHDRAGGLGLRGEAQREGRPAARQVAPEGDAHASRQATRSQDRVEGLEARREDACRVWLADRPGAGFRLVFGCLERDGGEGPDDPADGLAEPRGSGRTPLRPKGRERRRHVRGECRHASEYRTSVRMNQGLRQPLIG